MSASNEIFGAFLAMAAMVALLLMGSAIRTGPAASEAEQIIMKAENECGKTMTKAHLDYKKCVANGFMEGYSWNR